MTETDALKERQRIVALLEELYDDADEERSALVAAVPEDIWNTLTSLRQVSQDSLDNCITSAQEVMNREGHWWSAINAGMRLSQEAEEASKHAMTLHQIDEAERTLRAGGIPGLIRDLMVDNRLQHLRRPLAPWVFRWAQDQHAINRPDKGDTA